MVNAATTGALCLALPGGECEHKKFATVLFEQTSGIGCDANNSKLPL